MRAELEIRFNVVKKGEEIPRVYPMGHPKEDHYRATVNLQGTPELVLKLLEVITTYAAADAEEELVIV